MSQLACALSLSAILGVLSNLVGAVFITTLLLSIELKNQGC